MKIQCVKAQIGFYFLGNSMCGNTTQGDLGPGTSTRSEAMTPEFPDFTSSRSKKKLLAGPGHLKNF